ncbi:hypothetical protein [Mucilaginibacter panaciglaebae]|uniref:hypothetical protein n=1 Tax=Mucilaginibacter panaciglaebae TaxID=502331 RepID=UPI0031ECF525
MKNHYHLLLFVFLFIACNSKDHKKTLSSLVDAPFKKKIEKKKKKTNIQLLQGKWCSIENSESLFQIDSNEIFYYDATKYFKYTLSNNILKIKFDDYASSSQIKFKGNDTLIMIGLGKADGIIDTVYRCSK